MITVILICILFTYFMYRIIDIYDLANVFAVFVGGPVIGFMLGVGIAFMLPMLTRSYVKIYDYNFKEKGVGQYKNYENGNLFYTFFIYKNGEYEIKHIDCDKIRYSVCDKPKYIMEYGVVEEESLINYFAIDDISEVEYVMEVDDAFIQDNLLSEKKWD